jgi:hypothetical protein
MKIKREIKQIIAAIKAVWKGTEDGVRQDNPEFVNWLLKKQLQEIEEKQYTVEVMIKEYADCFLIIVKWFDAQGLDIEQEVLKRLESRYSGRTKEINKKYDQMWQRENKT